MEVYQPGPLSQLVASLVQEEYKPAPVHVATLHPYMEERNVLDTCLNRNHATLNNAP